VELPSGVGTTRCGELALRGKDSRVTAYGLSDPCLTAGF
jgi:hypothetical protein